MGEPPFICPYCETELSLPEDVWYYTCEHCHNRLDLKSQFAFLRGLDAFREGQDLLDKVSPRKRRWGFHPVDKASLTLFMEAYSSLQVAFLAELAEGQREVGVRMMTSMSDEFMKRSMVSPLEANYWNTLMIEQTAQAEYDQLKTRLETVNGHFRVLKRWRWRNRQKQLIASLEKLDQKIALLERQIEFVDIPRARNTRWKPTA